jgi:hypothetical protein
VRAIHREGHQPLHDARVEQYRARELRLRAGWTQMDVYGSSNLRKMKTAGAGELFNRRWISENSKANRIETMKGPAESGEICSVEVEKIAKKIAKNKRCYANTLRPAQGCC